MSPSARSPLPGADGLAKRASVGSAAPAEEEEDDYMNMTFGEPSASTTSKSAQPKESSLQRRARLKRQAEARARIPSKKEKEAADALAREQALAQSLDSSNRGFKLLAKLGYRAGAGLGPAQTGVAQPIAVSVKEDRSGIGRDSDRKRKAAVAIEGASKRVRESEDEFRERVRLEHLESRLAGQLGAAQRVAEKFDVEADADAANAGDAMGGEARVMARPLKSMNVLWRGVVRDRTLRERERRMKHDMLQSGPRLGTFVDPEEEADDRMALGKTSADVLEEEIEDEDEELDEFNALPATEKLAKLVQYLRDKYHYCFWCKFHYPDKEMEGCPGPTEEDHD